jgi:8-oxo-dGTP pyrophosphatase MutT (NUDIX family)
VIPVDRNAEEEAPQPSATIVLARAAPGAPELFLVHRHSRASFGASYVFPGGVLEREDCAAPDFTGDLPADAANRCLGLISGGLDYYCAAIRELFEETGVLLAHRCGEPLPRGSLERSRGLLNAGRLRWPDFLRENGLTLSCEALHYFAWWITPRALPRRYSTRFFLAVLPEGQEASHDGRELTDSRWTTAAAAIDASHRRELTLPLPTLTTLRDLAELEGLPALLEWARRRARKGVPRILPAIVTRDGRDRILVPGDPEYPRGET